MKVFEFILLLVSATSFLIYEQVPFNTYATKVRKELKEIVALHSLEDAEFAEFDYRKDSTVYSLSSIKSKAVFFNSNMPTFSMIENPVSLSFDWQAKDGATNYISPYHLVYRADFTKNANSLKSTVYELEFEVEVSKFKFTRTWEKSSENEDYISKGTIDNTYTTFKAKCLDESCPFTKDILLEVINVFLSEKKTEMNEVLNKKGVDAYYKNMPLDQLVQKVYTRTSNAHNENNVDLSLESIPEYSSDSGLIIKRKAKLNDLDITGSSTFSGDSSQRFNINKKLIQNLISQNLFNIVYEQANNPSPQFELTVAYLKQIMDVDSSYPDNTQLQVSAEMNNVAFNEGDSISGSVDFTVYIVSKSDFEDLLTFTLKIGFKFTPTLFQNGLNFVLLAKDLNIMEVKPTSTIKDGDLLLSWIQNTYLVALGNNEFNLFSLAFDLSNYFSTNKLAYEFKNDYLSIKKNE